MSMTLAHLLPERHFPPEVGELAVSDMHLDSRALGRGDLFVALAGETTDGHDFIDAAVTAGAVAILSEAEQEQLEQVDSVPVIGVPDLRARTGELAGRFFGEPGRALRVLAVTGTNGKTSTAWFLRDALQTLGRETALLGTLGAHCGGQAFDTGHTTPDVISVHRWLNRFRQAGAEVLVMEASSHALAQNRLDQVPVSTGVFTNITHEHLDYHGDMESYFRAKALLFERPELELAVINADDAWGRRLLDELPDGVRAVAFGGAADAAIGCVDFSPHEGGMRVELHLAGERLVVDTALFGRFNVDNLLAVAGVLHGLGESATGIRQALAGITPVPGRMEPVDRSRRPRVLVDYAHTPDALEKALASVRAHFAGRVICVVGCGGDRDRGKRPRMGAVAEAGADLVVLTADNPRSESVDAIIEAMRSGMDRPDTARVETDRRTAVERAVAEAGPDDVVLLAGKGHESWQEVAGEFRPLDDRELARAALNARGGAA